MTKRDFSYFVIRAVKVVNVGYKEGSGYLGRGRGGFNVTLEAGRQG
jgi:hypothetical protein